MQAPKINSAKGITLTINLSRSFRARVWLGMSLIKLGIRITGMNCEVLTNRIDSNGAQ